MKCVNHVSFVQGDDWMIDYERIQEPSLITDTFLFASDFPATHFVNVLMGWLIDRYQFYV